MLNLAQERERMVERQVARRGVRDDYVLEAMREVPREAFVERKPESSVIDDHPRERRSRSEDARVDADAQDRN
jgi:protein-L-isoaspartate O-methyltransferase